MRHCTQRVAQASLLPTGPRSLRPPGQQRASAARRRSGRALPRLPVASLAGSSEEQKQAAPEAGKPDIKQTMADLDALLGIEDKPEEKAEEAPKAAADGSKITISPEVLRTLAEAEAQRAEKLGSSVTNAELQGRIADSIERIVEQARKLAEEEAKAGGKEGASSASKTLGEEAVRQELNSLYQQLAGPNKGVDPEDLKKMKEEVFGPSTFWVTETRPLAMQSLELGVVIRGNLRGKRETVFKEVCDRTAALFGDRYVVRLVEDSEAALEDFQMGGTAGTEGADGAPEPRVMFEVLPALAAQPAPTAAWQRVAAGVLLVLTLGSTLQFGLAANIGLLPKETLQWLANPANLNSDILPPGLETYDPLPFLSSTGNVFLVTLLPQLIHEVAHTLVAGMRGIKIAPSYLIPNSQLGTFGSVTQLKSMVRNRTDLFDFSASALVAGGLTSLALFVAGLAASHGGGSMEPGLFPVPSQLFQGSLLLGSLAKLGLGSEALSHAQVYVSPLLVGGWCGLVTTALNCLPVGNLDGGRTMMSAFGRNALGVSSLFSYVGLGLGLLGSSLALPFGLYVLICQRTAENYIQDEVSGVSEKRRLLAGALIAFAVLTLAPMAPDVADVAAVSSPANFI